MPQSLSQIWVHLIFSTKERRPFLQHPEFREAMFKMLAHHVKQTDCLSASVGGTPDHVHLLMALSRTITLAKLVEVLSVSLSYRLGAVVVTSSVRPVVEPLNAPECSASANPPLSLLAGLIEKGHLRLCTGRSDHLLNRSP